MKFKTYRNGKEKPRTTRKREEKSKIVHLWPLNTSAAIQDPTSYEVIFYNRKINTYFFTRPFISLSCNTYFFFGNISSLYCYLLCIRLMNQMFFVRARFTFTRTFLCYFSLFASNTSIQTLSHEHKTHEWSHRHSKTHTYKHRCKCNCFVFTVEAQWDSAIFGDCWSNNMFI